MDEAAIYLLPGVVRRYAPQGHPPQLQVSVSHDHLSMMSGITPAGKVYTLVCNFPLRGVESVHFLLHLHRWVGTKLLVIWDNSPIHRGQTVQSFLEAGASQ